MKRLLLVLTIVFCFLPYIHSQKDSTVVGPGVVYYSEYRAGGPWHFDIVAIDLTNPWLKLQTVKGQDRLNGGSFEKTTSMAARNDYNAHRVVAAVNGDFYNTGTGEPVSTQVVNGQLLKNANDRWNFAWNNAKQSLMSVSSSSGKIIKGDSIFSLTAVNAARNTNNLIMYNSFFGTSTGTNQYGTEVLINPINEWKLNDTLICVVENKTVTGNMGIPGGKAVLSAHGTAASFINNNVNTGDTIKLLISLTPGLPGLNQLIGGGPVIVQNGTAQGDNVDRHPRTAIGINQDSTKLYFVTVDGRQPGYSVGMTLLELGNYMKEWGCYQALNLDGGGSTTMVVRGQIKNSPSDIGGERSVANSLLLVSTAPDDSLHHIVISPKVSFTAANTSAQFSVAGYDQYYNPRPVPPASIMWSLSGISGTISTTGLFIAGTDTGTGYVYVQSGSLIDTAVVHITKVASIVLQPNPVILQPTQYQQMTAVARDNYNNVISLSPSDYSWGVEGNVGLISTTGLFTATTQGEGTIVAEYDSVQGTASVQVGASTYVLFDDFTTTAGYTLDGLRVNLAECSFTTDTNIYVSTPSSGKLHYSLTTGGTSTLYINKTIPISGTPDAIGVSVYGDGRGHWLRGEFKDADAERFIIDFTSATPGIDWTNEWRYLEVPFTSAVPSWANPNATLTFPVSWWRLYLAETSEAKKDSGTIYFDDFKVHFIATEVEEKIIPDKFSLEQNYPNPFNPSTVIRFNIPYGNQSGMQFVSLKVFDILGKEVAVLVNEPKPAGSYDISFSAAKLPAGVYFYRLTTGSLNETKKMILLK